MKNRKSNMQLDVDLQREREQRFRDLVEQLPLVVFETDKQGTIVITNREGFRMFGYAEEDLEKKINILDMLVQEDRERAAENIRKVFSGKNLGAVQYTALRRDDTTFPVEIQSNLILSRGKAVGLRGIVSDLSERRRTEWLLQTQRDLALALNSAKNLDETLKISTDTAIRISGMDCGGVILVDEMDGSLNLAYHHGVSQQFVRQLTHSMSYASITNLVMAGKSVYTHHQNLIKQLDIKRKEKMNAVAVIPILVKNRTVAAFIIASHTVDEVTTFYRNALETIAAQIGEVIVRSQKEQEVEENRRKLQTTFDSIDDFLFVLDYDGRILEVNRTVVKRLGYARETLVGESILMLHPEDRHGETAAMVTDIAAGKRDDCPVPLLTKDHTLIPVETNYSRTKWGRQDVLIGISRDITERIEATGLLKESEERLSLAVKGTGVGLWDWKIQTGEVFFDERWAEICGYTLQELSPVCIETWINLCHPDDMEKSNELLQQHFNGKTEYYRCEVRMKHKNGDWVWVLDQGKVFEWDEEGRPVRMAGTHLEITERKQRESALHYALALQKLGSDIATVLANAAAGKLDSSIDEALRLMTEFAGANRGSLFVISDDGASVTNTNEWCATKQDSQKSLLQNIPFTTFGWHQEELLSNRVISISSRNDYPASAKGELEWIDTHGFRSMVFIPQYQSGRLVGALGIYGETGKEITWPPALIRMLRAVGDLISNALARKRAEKEQARLEEQLHQSQKLESIGTLAGGIAHDFNNLLGGIFGYIDMAAEATTDRIAANYLAKALGAIDRARGLTGQLLTFAKGGAPVKKRERLAPIIKEMSTFALSGSNVSPRFAFASELWPCEFDRNQISQVIDNIIINAQQAMPQGGTVEITAENLRLPDKSPITLPAGDYVKIAVKDQGIGMPGDIVSKIFDPFFTTKSKGHGLGLSTCFSIINRHEGYIEVESEPGKGSTFTFYLPAAPDASAEISEAPVKVHKGSGIFLVMDDEEVIRDTIGNMLESFGYSVHYAKNGNEVIEFFKAAAGKEKISGCILDLTIPGGLGGRETISIIREFDQKTPVFVASGYADDPVMADPASYGLNGSICKPFKRVELAEMLNTLKM